MQILRSTTFILAFLFAAHAWATEGELTPTKQIMSSVQSLFSSPGISDTKLKLMSNIPNFCGESQFEALKISGGEMVITEDMQELTFADRAQLEKSKYQLFLDAVGISPWQRSLLPSRTQKKYGLIEYARYYSNFDGVKQLYSDLYHNRITWGSSGRISLHEASEVKFPRQKELESMLGESVLAVACQPVTTFKIIDCAKALKKAIAFAAPRYGDIAAFPVYQKVLQDPKYIEGARLAAVTVLSRFMAEETHGAHLYQDILNGYLNAGLSMSSAQDATWDILAVIASGGPNTPRRLESLNTDYKFESLKVSISIMALAIPFLDSISVKYQSLYSLPKEVKTYCLMNKPYHFWMTAYLSRYLTKDGHSPIGSAAAAFIAQKAYEMKSETLGRIATRTFTEDPMGHWNNMIRVDLSFSSAGAVFGAQAAKNKQSEMNIDKGLKILIRSARELKPLESQHAELWEGNGMKGYLRWQEIMNPESVFHFHAKQIK